MRQGAYDGNTLTMDELAYEYDGNQLLGVSDSGHANLKNEGFYDGNTTGSDYAYDVNGNRVEDNNKGITSINYNHLSLPKAIKINTVDVIGDTQDGRIAYVYDATGVKLQKKVFNHTNNSIVITSYAGGYIYEDVNGQEALKMFPHPEGYVAPVLNTTKSINKFNKNAGTFTLSGFMYAFNYTDHLGNVRLTYADSDGDGAIKPSSEIISEKNYYPFGLEHKGYNNVVSSNSNSVAQKFKYNGKELEEQLGKDTYAYGWRDYDPTIGRFGKVDRFAEKYYSLSTYSYAGNNPIIFVDIQGDSISAGSQRSFNIERNNVSRRRDRIDRRRQRLENRGASQEKIDGLTSRIEQLDQTLTDLNTLESSEQFYRLETIGENEKGSISLDGDEVVIRYSSTSLFVQEATHAARFDSGEQAFYTNGTEGAVDIGDEVAAYRAQYAYDPSSVTGLRNNSGVTVNSLGDINNTFVQGIQSNGENIYAPGGALNLGVVPLNINSTRADLIRAYPDRAEAIRNKFAPNYTIRSAPTIYIRPGL